MDDVLSPRGAQQSAPTARVPNLPAWEAALQPPRISALVRGNSDAHVLTPREHAALRRRRPLASAERLAAAE